MITILLSIQLLSGTLSQRPTDYYDAETGRFLGRVIDGQNQVIVMPSQQAHEKFVHDELVYLKSPLYDNLSYYGGWTLPLNPEQFVKVVGSVFAETSLLKSSRSNRGYDPLEIVAESTNISGVIMNRAKSNYAMEQYGSDLGARIVGVATRFDIEGIRSPLYPMALSIQNMEFTGRDPQKQHIQHRLNKFYLVRQALLSAMGRTPATDAHYWIAKDILDAKPGEPYYDNHFQRFRQKYHPITTVAGTLFLAAKKEYVWR